MCFHTAIAPEREILVLLTLGVNARESVLCERVTSSLLYQNLDEPIHFLVKPSINFLEAKKALDPMLQINW